MPSNEDVVSRIAEDVKAPEAADPAPAKEETLDERVANLEAIVSKLAGHL